MLQDKISNAISWLEDAIDKDAYEDAGGKDALSCVRLLRALYIKFPNLVDLGIANLNFDEAHFEGD